MPETYNEILNPEIDPDSPFTTSLATRYRDNPIAIVKGAAGAPRISRRTITPGGSGVDGDLLDASPAISLPGYYEFGDVNLTLARTFPFLSHVRVNGDLTLTSVLSLATGVITDPQWYKWFGTDRLNVPSDGAVVSGRAGGGGNGGAGGASGTGAAGGRAKSLAGFNRPWLNLPLFPGGASSGNGGGGAIVLEVSGNVTMTGGGQIRARGGEVGNGGWGTGAGGGIVLVCSGTCTDLTLRADGGTFDSAGNGGGGGGIVIAIAREFLGATTLSAAAGAGGHSGGLVGQTQQITMTEGEINALFLR